MKQTKIISIKKAKNNQPKPSLEYELMASLCFEQFGKASEPDFEKLLNIPVEDRIEALIKEYGVMNMHRLVQTMLLEFSLRLGIPESRKLSTTAMSVCACDIILAAGEDNLSMEDLVIFFHLAGKGKYGKFKSLLTHFDIMAKLETYRKERMTFRDQWIVERGAGVKFKLVDFSEPTARSCPEPVRIGEIIDRSPAKVIAMKVNGRERN